MTVSEKILSLQKVISDNLRALIPGDFILADAPYYHNIGDVLIWEGIKDFTNSLSGKNLGTSCITSFKFPPLKSDTTILLMGGGNFGDLWREFQNFRINVVKHYPNNRIVMFPQSVWYDNENLIDEDANILNSHPDLYLCARDKVSYDFMKTHFKKCHILLVPDMAFFISAHTLNRYKRLFTSRRLYLKRTDKELDSRSSIVNFDREGYETHDWPTYEKKSMSLWLEQRLLGLAYRTKKTKYITDITSYISDLFAQILVRKNFVKKGFNFISPYSEIVTTRLHAMIAGILLERSVTYIDNTSGKLSAFADTWLNDLNLVKPYKSIL